MQPMPATGKIQRCLFVDVFFNKNKPAIGHAGVAPASPSPAGQSALSMQAAAVVAAADEAAPHGIDADGLPSDWYHVVARTLCALGVRHMFGVVGIPVTQLASAAQAAGIRSLSFRNEQVGGGR
jgi:hypothetical protein